MITDDKNVVVIAAKIMKFDDKLKIIELNRREVMKNTMRFSLHAIFRDQPSYSMNL